MPRPLPLLVLLAWVLAPAPATAQASLPEAARLEAALLEATNAARVAEGLAPLRADEGLARAARAHAAENAARGVLDHGSPDPSRDTPLERVAAAGVALVEVGENLARLPGTDLAGRAVAGWMASPPHRRNLLDPSFTHVGFGAAAGPGGTYVAQVFGARPLRRLGAEAREVREPIARWTLCVEGPPGTEAMAFVADAPLAALELAGGATELVFELAADAAPRLEIGVATSARRYLRSDAGRLDPSAGWRRDPSAPAGPVRVTAARADLDVRRQVEVTLRYDTDEPRLRLFVDGAHLPGALPDGGVLVARLPSASVPRTIAAGLADGGSARVLERFTLLPGPPPTLRPGVPPGLDLEESWTRPGSD